MARKKTAEKTYTVRAVAYTLLRHGLRYGSAHVVVFFSAETNCSRALTTRQLLARISKESSRYGCRWIWLAGVSDADPLDQVGEELIDQLHDRCGYSLGIETNGRSPIPAGLSHVLICPKGPRQGELKADEIHVELKHGQEIDTDLVRGIECSPRNWFVRPSLDDSKSVDEFNRNIAWCHDYALRHPGIRFSVPCDELLHVERGVKG